MPRRRSTLMSRRAAMAAMAAGAGGLAGKDPRQRQRGHFLNRIGTIKTKLGDWKELSSETAHNQSGV